MLHLDVPLIDTKGLRQFGLILGAILIIIFGFFLPWVWKWDNVPNFYSIGIGFVMIIWALIAPELMRGLYNIWMKVGMFIGNIINSIILAIVFFFLITPMGLIMRMLGKDPMCRILDKNAKSYRVKSNVPKKNHVERPY